MIRIAIMDDYQNVALRMADWSKLGPDVDIVSFTTHLPTSDEAAPLLQDFDVMVCMRERMPVPRALIERLPKLKLIVFTGSHSQMIDLEAAAERDIPVCRTSGKPSSSAAEMAWALIMACVRNLPREDANVRAGHWQTTVGTTLEGKTLGLIGLGNLGGMVARYGRAFGMNILAWSANLTQERAEEHGATRVNLDDLLRSSDIVSIHLKLSERSVGLIGRGELDLMKSSAILINTARGPIVDEVALIDALRSRGIRGAGLDVFHHEPLPADHPFRRLDNIVVTPHLGFVTEEGYQSFYGGALEVIQSWRAGNLINRYVA